MNVLHVPVPRVIEFVEQRIMPSVEVQRLEPKPIAQRFVENRRRLDPAVLEEHFRIGVPVEDIGPESLQEAGGGKVVFYVGIARPGRDAKAAQRGDEQGGLSDTPAPFAVQSDARLVARGIAKCDVGVIADFIANRVTAFETLFQVRIALPAYARVNLMTSPLSESANPPGPRYTSMSASFTVPYSVPLRTGGAVAQSHVWMT